MCEYPTQISTPAALNYRHEIGNSEFPIFKMKKSNEKDIFINVFKNKNNTSNLKQIYQYYYQKWEFFLFTTGIGHILMQKIIAADFYF